MIMFAEELACAEAASDVGAPWWGVPVVAGAFLLLGAILGFLFNWFLEGRKQKRELRARWDANLLDHTSAVTTLTKTLALAARDYHVFEKREFDEATAPSAAKMHNAYGDLQRECDLLSLVAPPVVRDAAKKVMERAWPIVRLKETDDLIEVYESLQDAADDLAAEVRKHFGIK